MPATAALQSGTSSVRAGLREATLATHLRMHGLPQFRAIAEGRLARTEYCELLQALHAYHSSISAAARRGNLTRISSSARRMVMLEADLTSLGERPSSRSQLWRPRSDAALYGALYVAEGSVLGGKVIAGQLDYLFAGDAAGRTFFKGDTETTRSWRSFLTALERDCADPRLMPDLIDGAMASFDLFAASMAR